MRRQEVTDKQALVDDAGRSFFPWRRQGSASLSREHCCLCVQAANNQRIHSGLKAHFTIAYIRDKCQCSLKCQGY